jgi:hypothetical protein
MVAAGTRPQHGGAGMIALLPWRLQARYLNFIGKPVYEIAMLVGQPIDDVAAYLFRRAA